MVTREDRQDKLILRYSKRSDNPGKGYSLRGIAAIFSALDREFIRWLKANPDFPSKRDKKARLEVREINRGSIELILGLGGEFVMGAAASAFGAAIIGLIKQLASEREVPTNVSHQQITNINIISGNQHVSLNQVNGETISEDVSERSRSTIEERQQEERDTAVSEPRIGQLSIEMTQRGGRRTLKGTISSEDLEPKPLVFRNQTDEHIFEGGHDPFGHRYEVQYKVVHHYGLGVIKAYRIYRVRVLL